MKLLACNKGKITKNTKVPLVHFNTASNDYQHYSKVLHKNISEKLSGNVLIMLKNLQQM